MSTLMIEIDEASLASRPGGLIIGADPDLSDVVLEGASVAPRHARLRRIEGRLWLEDLNGGGGTWVDGTRLHPFAAFPCRTGATLRLGEVEGVLALRHGLAAPLDRPPGMGPTGAAPSGSRRRLLGASLLGIVLVAAVLGLGIGYRYYQAYEADAAAWREAVAANTEESYHAYLRLEPDGRFTADAETALTRIAEERITADDALFQAAAERDTLEGYQDYLTQLPEGRHAAEAQDAIARLEKAAAETAQAEADAEAWRKAENANTRAAFQDYLNDFPQGAHVSEARERLASLARAAADAAAASEAAEKRRQEEAAAAKQRAAEAGKDWEAALRQHSFQGYSQFLEKHPNAAHAAEATNHLGYMYANGEGVPKDYAKALELFRKAAAGKNPEAMFNLGYHYHHGIGVPKDPAEAASWYRKAIDAGNRPAVSLLQVLQRETGVP